MNQQRPHRAPAPPEDASFTETEEMILQREPVQRTSHAPPAVRPTNGNSMETAAAEDYARHDFPVTGFERLAGAVAAVMAEIKPVAKSGWNDFHKYNYARMQDLSTELTPLMGRHGIVVIQNELDRSMFDNGSVVAVRYEFTIIHKSGEIWPERPRYTGMSSCRNTKGGFDDKCFNKCHTAARKYFLIGLFQIPTEEESVDGDTGEVGAPHTRPAPPRRAPSPEGKLSPHLLPIIDQETPDSWAERFLKLVDKATTSEEVDRWYNENYNIFQKLKEKHGAVYDKLVAAMDARDALLRGDAKPTNGTKAAPKDDPISSGQIAAPKRSPPPPKIDPAHAQWLDELRNAFSACESLDQLAEEQVNRMVPRKGKVPDLLWNEAVDIARAEYDRLDKTVPQE